jgi:hypothetical protein
MARIRTIKPEFWTDDKIVGLSPMARLFFIGMWNFADDHGGIERSALQLKMKIFPGDVVDVEPLIQELLRTGLIVEYEADGALYLNIRNFLRHQRINRPSTPRIPSFMEGVQRKPPEDSRRDHGGLNEGSRPEGKGSGSGSGRDLEWRGSLTSRKGEDRRGEPVPDKSTPSTATALVKLKPGNGTAAEKKTPTGEEQLIELIADELRSGKLTPAKAKEQLRALALTKAEIEAFFEVES